MAFIICSNQENQENISFFIAENETVKNKIIASNLITDCKILTINENDYNELRLNKKRLLKYVGETPTYADTLPYFGWDTEKLTEKINLLISKYEEAKAEYQNEANAIKSYLQSLNPASMPNPFNQSLGSYIEEVGNVSFKDPIYFTI